MKFMDRLPTVMSCCFCCFLRAGTVVIALFSFCIGLLFAPNINYAKGFWTLEYILSNVTSAVEEEIHMTLGVASIMLCVVSSVLLVGALFNKPTLILVYQYGAIVYSVTVLVLFFILAIFCFFVHTNCYLAGVMLIGLIMLNVGLTAYFIIVTNSLRKTITYLSSDDLSKNVLK